MISSSNNLSFGSNVTLVKSLSFVSLEPSEKRKQHFFIKDSKHDIFSVIFQTGICNILLSLFGD